MLMYLHGFRSAPASLKARMLVQRMDELGLGDHVWCEQLPTAPAKAIRFVEEQIARDQTPVTLVGSSLGGFYATYLAEKHDLRAVLINPAVVAHLTLADYLGPQFNSYTGEQFTLMAEHIRQLEALNLTTLTDPGRFWVLVETGDEVLDFRVAVERYAGARQTVIEGGDHSFQHFDQFLDGIIEFAGLRR